jgi:HEAT repeat protein
MSGIRELIEKLSSADEADRIYAAEDLGYANDAEGVAPLLERLPNEPSRAAREAMFAALVEIEHDAVIQGALSLLDSDDSFLRNQAVQLLQARGETALPYLARAFQAGDRDRRKFVIDIVTRIHDGDPFGIYGPALSDADLNVVITAVESVGVRRETRFRGRIEEMISPSAHPMLLSACLEALARIGNRASLDWVRERLGGGLPDYLRPSYLKLLGAAGAPGDVREIAAFAGDPMLDSAILNALAALRNRHPDLPIPLSLAGPLRAMVERNPAPLAFQAVRLLSIFVREENVFAFLAESLNHPEKAVRIGAIQAMRQAGGERAAKAVLERLAQESDEEVRQAWSSPE